MNGKILRKEKVDLRFPADRGPGVCAQQQIPFSVQETITKAMGLAKLYGLSGGQSGLF
jgi:hypothetical protein